MQDRAENGDTPHTSGCGLADNVDVQLARLTQLFHCGALQVCFLSAWLVSADAD